jgi:hypothetical protein
MTMSKLKFEPTPELLALAKRVVWFKSAEDSLQSPLHFVAHALTYGTHNDIRQLRRQLGDEQLRAAIDQAPAGVIDDRSWNYWRLMLDMPHAPVPCRKYPGESPT